MTAVYGSRDIIRNPALLRIEENSSFIVEDKKPIRLWAFILDTKLAEEFFNYTKKQELLKSAQKSKIVQMKSFLNLKGH